MTNAIGDDNVLQYSFVEGNAQVQVDEILYVETNRHKNFFCTIKGVYSIYKKLDEIEEDLQGRGFVRVHQSYLVNMNYVEKISSYILRLTTGKEISVPKSRYPEVKKKYILYMEEKI